MRVKLHKEDEFLAHYFPIQAFSDLLPKLENIFLFWNFRNCIILVKIAIAAIKFFVLFSWILQASLHFTGVADSTSFWDA